MSTAASPNTAPRGTLRPLSVAPMMDRTNRHFRFFFRKLTRQTLLYTEMVTTGAIVHGNQEHLLGFSPEEHPIAVQLGGDNPKTLAACARIAAEFGYDEVNLNVGCPSDRVQNGSFGACLMATPEKVADAVTAMREAVDLPVTVKHRIGIDDLDSYEHLRGFVGTIAAAGCDRVSVHARKAILGGLTPKQNRTIPPLRYDDVHRLKRDFPDLAVEINGGLTTLDAAESQLDHVDAVMIGRAAYDTPAIFLDADRRFFGGLAPATSPHDVVRSLFPYIEKMLVRGERLHDMSRHLLTLFAGRPGARAWRRLISENAPRPGAGINLLEQALRLVSEEG